MSSRTTPRLFRLSEHTWEQLGRLQDVLHLRSRADSVAVAAWRCCELLREPRPPGHILDPVQLLIYARDQVRMARREPELLQVVMPDGRKRTIH